MYLQILETSTCKLIQEFKSHSSRVKWCTFTKCSQLLVSVSEDGTAKVIILINSANPKSSFFDACFGMGTRERVC